MVQFFRVLSDPFGDLADLQPCEDISVNNPENLEAVKTATNFLILAGLFQIFYSIQVITVGALIGLQDTFVPVLMSLMIWSLGLVGSYVMGIILWWQGIGIWLGMILSPLLSSVILS